jgi:hypothetical protein
MSSTGDMAVSGDRDGMQRRPGGIRFIDHHRVGGHDVRDGQVPDVRDLRRDAFQGIPLGEHADQLLVLDDQQTGDFQPGQCLHGTKDGDLRTDFRERLRANRGHGLFGQGFPQSVVVLARFVILQRVFEFAQMMFDLCHAQAPSRVS